MCGCNKKSVPSNYKQPNIKRAISTLRAKLNVIKSQSKK